MRICAIADLHGNLPANIPTCDVLLIAGDICPSRWARGRAERQAIVDHQAWWLRSCFERWLRALDCKHIVATWGNHDWIGEHPEQVPELPWQLLVDSSTTIEGFKFYGMPWTPRFRDWA